MESIWKEEREESMGARGRERRREKSKKTRLIRDCPEMNQNQHLKAAEMEPMDQIKPAGSVARKLDPLGRI